MPVYFMQVLTRPLQIATKVIVTFTDDKRQDKEDFGAIDSAIKMFISNTQNGYRIIGFDTWTCNSGKRDNPIAGIALSDGQTCLICQLWSFKEIPTSLSNFLRLSTFTFVSSGVQFSTKKLEENYGLGMRNVVELGQFTHLQMWPVDRATAESLVCERWDVCVLNGDQISYVTRNASCYFLALLEKYSRVKIITNTRGNYFTKLTDGLSKP